MNIAINALAISPNMTGIGTYTQALVSSTIDFGSPHSYLYLTGANGLVLPINARNDLRQIVAESPDALWEQLHLPTELAFRKADIYHSPLFTCPVVDEIPCVITIHDAIPETRSDLCSPKFLNFYRSRIGPSLRAAIKIITTSEFSRQEIIRHLSIPPDKIKVIHQGVSGGFSPKNASQARALRERLKLPGRYILYVGMVEPRKNLERLISAFGKVAREIPDIHLVMAGRKDDPPYPLVHAIEKSAPDRILELGYMDSKDLPALYAGAHVFAFPSLYEGFGRPVVEAMASGVPVVTSRVSSLPEIAGDAALLADPENEDSLAEALIRLCRDEKHRATLVERGLARAGDFTYQKFGERLVSFYNQMEKQL